MTKSEFKELYDRFLNPGEMPMDEYCKLKDRVNSEVKQAITVAYDRFSVLVIDTYGIDPEFRPSEFSMVFSDYSNKDEVCIVYGSCNYAIFTKIPIDLISSWVEGDFSDLIEKSYSIVKSSLGKDIEKCKQSIDNLTREMDDAQKILDEIAKNESHDESIEDKTTILGKYWDYIDNYAI